MLSISFQITHSQISSISLLLLLLFSSIRRTDFCLAGASTRVLFTMCLWFSNFLAKKKTWKFKQCSTLRTDVEYKDSNTHSHKHERKSILRNSWDFLSVKSIDFFLLFCSYTNSTVFTEHLTVAICFAVSLLPKIPSIYEIVASFRFLNIKHVFYSRKYGESVHFWYIRYALTIWA